MALQSASGGQVGGARMQYHLRMSLTQVDAFLFGKPEVFVNFAAKKIDENTGELTDQPTKDIIKTQLAAFAKFIGGCGVTNAYATASLVVRWRV